VLASVACVTVLHDRLLFGFGLFLELLDELGDNPYAQLRLSEPESERASSSRGFGFLNLTHVFVRTN
jgi:hypothetical protein